jgi:hypothetical protein
VKVTLLNPTHLKVLFTGPQIPSVPTLKGVAIGHGRLGVSAANHSQGMCDTRFAVLCRKLLGPSVTAPHTIITLATVTTPPTQFRWLNNPTTGMRGWRNAMKPLGKPGLSERSREWSYGTRTRKFQRPTFLVRTTSTIIRPISEIRLQTLTRSTNYSSCDNKLIWQRGRIDGVAGVTRQLYSDDQLRGGLGDPSASVVSVSSVEGKS